MWWQTPFHRYNLVGFQHLIWVYFFEDKKLKTLCCLIKLVQLGSTLSLMWYTIHTNSLKVWHTMADDKSHLDWEAIRRTAAVLKVFVAEFLHVRL